ncbi:MULTISPECIES: AAA family ATPase [Burkholderia cepacia complex]|uniref:AAA family ATPase n=1 Tax=Burkholderia cepacia complex TaxID=87882 RepID=UPI001CF59495|nr:MULTISPECIES: ATP-binding protein [Burkholderia cepacia complex]MCA8059643.1 ATP-binding protein [Burkholderia cepacia]MDN7695056.1 ATP-binding protein [Burkholderia cenocepacia]
MSTSVFESKFVLPDADITAKAKGLLGFESLYLKVSKQLQLLINLDQVEAWSKKHHGKRLALVETLRDQYPFAIFYGDVGTGKSAMAEAIGNRIAKDSKTEDSMLFKLSNRVRGKGSVGEMGTLISEAFAEIKKSIGKDRRAILIIDEGDSLAATRAQDQSHHEDKVAVNTLIQAIDELRASKGRIFTILCTNRMSVLDPAIQRRAAVVEHFRRPDAGQRKELFEMDLGDLGFTSEQIASLVASTGALGAKPSWTYSDIRTRVYPAAVALAFPDTALTFTHLEQALLLTSPSPALAD